VVFSLIYVAEKGFVATFALDRKHRARYNGPVQHGYGFP
jgi:hypothetical protein